jgi:hypothetical protein
VLLSNLFSKVVQNLLINMCVPDSEKRINIVKVTQEVNMTTLRSKSPKDTYQQLLKINGDKVDSTLRNVEGGDGTETPLKLATDKIAIQGKQWPTTDAPEGSILQVSADPTKLEWAAPVASVTNSITTSFFPGTIAPMVGTIRWYPSKQATIKSVFMFVSNPPTTPIVIDVKKSGVSIFGGQKPTITVANYTSTLMEFEVSMQPTDYLTVDILSGNGSDLNVRFEYQ